jgi:ABC-type amino acid transport substrate-binding protein
MFASIIMISGFTAGIASALTLQQLTTDIQGPDDLPGNLVGTLGGSTSETYLQNRGAGVQQYASVDAALEGLLAGDVDAVVYDAPLLRYRVKEDHAGAIQVLPHTFQRQDYAIALPPASPQRETINRILLERIALSAWTETLNRYLGSD